MVREKPRKPSLRPALVMRARVGLPYLGCPCAPRLSFSDRMLRVLALPRDGSDQRAHPSSREKRMS